MARNRKSAAYSISFKCMSANGVGSDSPKPAGQPANPNPASLNPDSPKPDSPKPDSPVLRPAAEQDIEAIRSIYNHEVENGTSTFDLRPRTRKEQKLWLRSHVGAYAAIVAAISEEVVGFGSLSPYRERPAYRGTAEISVYVHHSHKRKGIGKALLDDLIEAALRHGFHTLIARVSGPNDASHALFMASGFEKVGVEKEVGRKFNQWLDIAIYQRMLKSLKSPLA